MTSRTVLATSLTTLAFITSSPAIAKVMPVYTGTFSNVALSGYDPVAYFTQKAPVKGLSQFSTAYNGVKWKFASAAALAAFKADPAKFAPQYGGYCAWAVSQGDTAAGDPEVWKIVGGKLYVNYNKNIGEKWSKNIAGNIAAADSKWPIILSK